MSRTHAKTKVGFASDPGETRDDFGNKTREFDALKGTGGELEKGLITMRNAAKVNGEKVQWLESQMVLDGKAIAQSKTLVRDHCSNRLRVTAEKVELRKRVNKMGRKTLGAISLA